MPSTCQGRRDTLSALDTSSSIACAPRALSKARPSAPRAVAVTAQPCARYWRTNSSPSPRDAPMTMAFMRGAPSAPGSEHLDGHRGGFAAADAQRRDAALELTLAQRTQERDDDARAARADRVAQRAGAAVHVHDLVRELELGHRGHGHGGESLVHFPQVHALGIPARLLQHLLDGTDR